MLHTTSTSSSGGHTQQGQCPTTVSGPRSAMRPATVMNTAGAAAQRCGWSLSCTDKTVSSAQPNANASSTTPVSTPGLAGMNGAAAQRHRDHQPGGHRCGDGQSDASPERRLNRLRSLDIERAYVGRATGVVAHGDSS